MQIPALRLVYRACTSAYGLVRAGTPRLQVPRVCVRNLIRRSPIAPRLRRRVRPGWRVTMRNVRPLSGHCYRMLRPGGTLLVTVPSVSRLCGDGDCWRLTTERCCSTLVGEHFRAEDTQVRSYGNVLVAMAFLTGVAREELRRAELDYRDPEFPVIIAARAVREP